MARIFVTGATGNVGRVVVRELLRRGYQITAMVRKPTELEGCDVVIGDLAGIGALSEQVRACDGVIHLADSRTNRREDVISLDIKGTAALLDAWQRGNFVFASSQTVYGVPKGPLTESARLDPTCWYDLGKVTNEYQLRMHARTRSRGAAVAVRMALLYAPGTRPTFLSWMYEQCMGERAFVIDSEQHLARYGSSFIGGEDLGRAFADALRLGEGGNYNVAGGFATWREAIELFNRLAGTHARIVVRPGGVPQPGEVRLPQSRSVLDTTAFDRATGFTPRQTLKNTISEFLLGSLTDLPAQSS